MAAKSPEIVARVVELIPTMPLKAIARELGIARETVRAIRNRHLPHLARHTVNAVWGQRGSGNADEFKHTDAIPGTEKKVGVMAARMKAGNPLWHPGDMQGCLPPPALHEDKLHQERGWGFRDRPLDMPVLTLADQSTQVIRQFLLEDGWN